MGYFASRRKSAPLWHTALMHLKDRAGRSRNQTQGFPGGSVVKKPPVNAGHTGLTPGLGRPHMPRSNRAGAPQLLSPDPRAQELQLLKPGCPRARAPREKSLQGVQGPPLGSSPCPLQPEKAWEQQGRPSTAKNKAHTMTLKKETSQTQNTHNLIVWSSKQTQLQETQRVQRTVSSTSGARTVDNHAQENNCAPTSDQRWKSAKKAKSGSKTYK